WDCFRARTVQLYLHADRLRRCLLQRSAASASTRLSTVSAQKTTNATCTTITSRISLSVKQVQSADRVAAKSVTEHSGNVRCCRLSRMKRTSRTRFASCLKYLNRTVL